MTVSSILSDTWRIFSQNLLIFLAVGFAGAVLGAIIEFATGGPVSVDPVSQMPEFGLNTLVGTLINMLVFQVVSIVLHLAAWDILGNRPINISGYFNRGVAVVLPVILLSIVMGLIVGFGTLLLIIPGLYLAAAFAALVPVIAIEDNPWNGLARTWELTSGKRWTILGAAIVLIVIAILVSILLGIVVAFAPVIGSVIAQTLTIAVGAVFATVIYAQCLEAGTA